MIIDHPDGIQVTKQVQANNTNEISKLQKQEFNKEGLETGDSNHVLEITKII